MQKKAICLGLLIILSLILAGCQGMTAEQNQKLIQDLGKAYATQTQIKIPSEIESQQVSITHKCTDSDYGKNAHDYGYTTDWINDEQIQNKDQCNGNMLYEAICQEGFVKAIAAVNCADYGMICTNGACVINPETIDEQQCIDSDSGLNMMEFGFTAEFRNGQQINNDDKCSGNTLLEAVCKQGVTKAIERVRCQDYGLVCDNGVCLQEFDEEQDAGAAEDEEEADAAGGQRGAAGPTCVDPDGENPYVLGTLVFTYANGRQTTYRDECDPSGRYVWEQRCTVDPNNNPTFGTRSIDCQATGEVCRAGICVAADAGARGAAQTTCTDSDNGINFVTAGRVLLTTDGRATSWPDTCSVNSPNILLEQYCPQADARGVRQINCTAQGKQCINGACAPFSLAPVIGSRQLDPVLVNPALLEPLFCTDTDGKDSRVKGTIQLRDGTNYVDKCQADGIKLTEHYCSGGDDLGTWGTAHKTTTWDCGGLNRICRDGACVDQPAVQNIRLCEDFDGDDPYTVGQVHIITGTDVRIEKDECLDNNRLREHICGSNNVHGAKTYYCSNTGYSCKDGKCVDLRTSSVQQPLSSTGQAIPSPTIIKQYPILDTITIKKLI